MKIQKLTICPNCGAETMNLDDHNRRNHQAKSKVWSSNPALVDANWVNRATKIQG